MYMNTYKLPANASKLVTTNVNILGAMVTYMYIVYIGSNKR
jgi:hypothetical protein